MKMILILGMLALLIGWLWYRRSAASKAPDVPDNRIAFPYSAVAIRGPASACCASKKLAGERFLAKSPPELPLPDCDSAKCECYFVHFNDRRRESDRRSPFSVNLGSSGSGVYKVERRTGIDRRRSATESQ